MVLASVVYLGSPPPKVLRKISRKALDPSVIAANYGYNPRFTETLTLPPYLGQLQDTKALATRLAELHDALKAEMEYAQARQRENANRHRLPSPTYRVGDEVWLNVKNIQTTRPSKKLDWKRFGRFKIKKIISPYAYELDLPASMKIHPVFHVSKLEPCAADPLSGYIPPPAPPVIVEGEEQWEVEEILDSRLCYGNFQYLVRWKGYDTPTWEPFENISNSPVLLTCFHRLYPTKPGPTRTLAELESRAGATITDRHRQNRSRPVILPRRQLRSRVV